VASPPGPDDPELIEADPPAMFMLYFPLFSAGWALLEAAFVRVPFYPRWAVRLLGLGAVIALHPSPLTTVVFGVAVAWLGLALVRVDAPRWNELGAAPRSHRRPQDRGRPEPRTPLTIAPPPDRLRDKLPDLSGAL